MRGPFKKKNAYVVDDRRIDVGGLEEVDDSAGRVDAREAFGGGNHEHHRTNVMKKRTGWKPIPRLVLDRVQRQYQRANARRTTATLRGYSLDSL